MTSPGSEPFRRGFKRLTCPVLITRHGGLDGVALQKEEYHKLLNDLGIYIHVVTGREETRFGPISPHGQLRTVIARLDLAHPDSRRLYANAFCHGPETDGAEVLTDKQWMALFDDHRRHIRAGVEKVLQNIPDNTPVFVYNLLSLRHLHPAAAVAIKELIGEYPLRAFLSHSADPDSERPGQISRLKGFVRTLISANSPLGPYSGGPYQYPNLFHIVLNPTQREAFTETFAVPVDHVFEIPDFLEFKTREANLTGTPEPGFMAYLSRHAVTPIENSYGYTTVPVKKDAVIFLSPVRPVARKQLKEAMVAAHQYGLSRDRSVCFVVTHPDIDDPRYFLETVRFASRLGVHYLHLGNDFAVDTLTYVYTNMAALDCVGVVASSAGGWENALNEMANAGIPFFMNRRLNSFRPLTEHIGIRCHGMDFEVLEKVLTGWTDRELAQRPLWHAPQVAALFEWIDDVLSPARRSSLIRHNYRRAFRHLSSQATALKLWRLVWEIYARMSLR